MQALFSSLSSSHHLFHELSIRSSLCVPFFFHLASSQLGKRPFVLHEVSLFDPVVRLIPFIFVYGCAAAWALVEPDAFVQAPKQFMFAFGFLFCNFV
jgi:hypothetical protein